MKEEILRKELQLVRKLALSVATLICEPTLFFYLFLLPFSLTFFFNLFLLFSSVFLVVWFFDLWDCDVVLYL